MKTKVGTNITVLLPLNLVVLLVCPQLPLLLQKLP